MTIKCVIEQPKPEILDKEPVWVSGWAFGTEAVKEVAVSIDNGPFEPAQYGHLRADVFGHYPDSSHSEYCGFRVHSESDQQRPSLRSRSMAEAA